MSLCDTCVSPGACCKRMFFNRWDKEKLNNPYQDEKTVIDYLQFNIGENPFILSGWSDDHKAWVWTCKNLDDGTGRCRDYENRPKLCRDYEPGSDALCVMYKGPTI